MRTSNSWPKSSSKGSISVNFMRSRYLCSGRADVVASKPTSVKKTPKGQTQASKGQGRKVLFLGSNLLLATFLTPSSRRPLAWAMMKFTLFCCRSIKIKSITRSVPRWLTMLESGGTFSLFDWHSDFRFVRLCLVAFLVVHLDIKFKIGGGSRGSPDVVYPFCFFSLLFLGQQHSPGWHRHLHQDEKPHALPVSLWCFLLLFRKGWSSCVRRYVVKRLGH